MVILYYDYLIKNINIKNFNIEKRHIKLSIRSLKLKLLKYKKALNILIIEKNNISLLFQNICMNYFRKINYKNTCEQVRVTFQILDFLFKLDLLFGKFETMIFSEKTNMKQYEKHFQ
ncbi:hypothetical protein NUSPORA_02807 [Nucleospora cyclopteri]